MCVYVCICVRVCVYVYAYADTVPLSDERYHNWMMSQSPDNQTSAENTSDVSLFTSIIPLRQYQCVFVRATHQITEKRNRYSKLIRKRSQYKTATTIKRKKKINNNKYIASKSENHQATETS